jgi:uroporphyrin-III C-methyltransferase
MFVRCLWSKVGGGLVAAGRAGSTPVLIVENASRADERRVATTLAGLAEAAGALAGPALLMVGEAMALAQTGQDQTGQDQTGQDRAGEGAEQIETLLQEARA